MAKKKRKRRAETSDDENPFQTAGFLVFVATGGFTALEIGGFGIGLNWGLQTYLVIALLGGVIGGTLLASRLRWAGAIAGAVAGPCGLLAVSWYVSGREEVWTIELVIVQMIASLPGVGVRAIAKTGLTRVGIID